jgi:hypothetical protein
VRKYRISLHRCEVAPLSRHQLRFELSDLVDEVFKQTLFAHLTFSLPFLLRHSAALCPGRLHLKQRILNVPSRFPPKFLLPVGFFRCSRFSLFLENMAPLDETSCAPLLRASLSSIIFTRNASGVGKLSRDSIAQRKISKL